MVIDTDMKNALEWKNRLVDIVNEKSVFPTTVELHLTNFCNHNCVWCVADEIRQNNWVYPLEKAKQLINQLAEAKVQYLIFSGGGDPTIYKGIDELMVLSYNLGIENMVITNGTRLNEHLGSIAAKHCKTIRVSMDSGSEEVHNIIHRPNNKKSDNFNVIVSNLKRVAKEAAVYGNRVILSYVVVDESIGDIRNFMKLAKEIGVYGVDFKTNHFWDAERKSQVYSEIEKIVKDLDETEIHVSIEYPKDRGEQKEVDKWNTIWTECVIEANGDMYPCCHKSPQTEWNYGNVMETSFLEVWNNQKRLDIVANREKIKCNTCATGGHNKNVGHLLDLLRES